MSKESIRKQIEKASKEAEEFLASDVVDKQTKLMMRSLLTLLEIVVLVLLEKKTRKNSSNSGLPPSKNNGSNGNRNTDNRNAKKNGDQIPNTRVVKTSSTLSSKTCTECGDCLRDVKPTKTDSRKTIDIIYEVQEHTVTRELKICSSCKTENKPSFPSGMDGKLQYGMGIKASIVNFLMVQMLSLEKVSEHFRSLLGRFISPAVMLKYLAQFSKSLEGWEKQEIQKILKAPVIHVDETSLRVDKKNFWIHSYSYGDITLKFLHSKRGTPAINEIDIIPNYSGVIVHDCWASYLTYSHLEHGLCGAHILRELKFIEDSSSQKWATNMKSLLKDAAKTVANRSQKRVLNNSEQKTLQSRYRNILTRALKELPEFPASNGKRGRPKHTEAQNLWLRLKEYETSVLLFSHNKDVDFTNNRAERDLRDAKLKQKVSGTFRQLEYAEHFVRISSFVKSMRYKGYSSLEAILLAFNGNIPT